MGKRPRPQKGFVHLYTGNGKGKTTAALGLALRAAGAGLRVYIAQFLKKGDFSELTALRKFGKAITIRQFGTGKFVTGTPSETIRLMTLEGIKAAKAAVCNGKFDIVVLDEICCAIDLKIIQLNQLLNVLLEKPGGVEIILTGRNAPRKLIAMADLVTEMRVVKHYFDCGVKARKGIEY